MDLYAGIRGGDTPVGGGKYVEDLGFGHEVFNFESDAKGVFRGYVRPPGQGNVGSQRINIGRLGAAADDDRVENVLVFWVATHPALGGTRVVGWYDDATVFRGWKASPKKRVLPNGADAGFMVEARSARLLPSDDRVFVLPRATSAQAGIGQSNVWYAPEEWAKKLVAYREGVLAGRALPKPVDVPRVGRLADTEARLRIERAAMLATIAWCEQRNLPSKDVSLQRLGWDIEAGEGKGILRIEVKGSSLPLGDALLELTPNEFARMNEHRDSFRLSVVSVQNEAPKTTLVMFAWSRDAGSWIGEGGRYTLMVHEVVSARLELLVTPVACAKAQGDADLP